MTAQSAEAVKDTKNAKSKKLLIFFFISKTSSRSRNFRISMQVYDSYKFPLVDNFPLDDANQRYFEKEGIKWAASKGRSTIDSERMILDDLSLFVREDESLFAITQASIKNDVLQVGFTFFDNLKSFADKLNGMGYSISDIQQMLKT